MSTAAAVFAKKITHSPLPRCSMTPLSAVRRTGVASFSAGGRLHVSSRSQQRNGGSGGHGGGGGSTGRMPKSLSGCVGAAGAAAATVAAMGTAAALCETNKKNLHIKDPMTAYYSVLSEDDTDAYPEPASDSSERQHEGEHDPNKPAAEAVIFDPMTPYFSVLATDDGGMEPASHTSEHQQQQQQQPAAVAVAENVMIAPSPASKAIGFAGVSPVTGPTTVTTTTTATPTTFTAMSSPAPIAPQPQGADGLPSMTKAEERLEDAAQKAKKHAGGLKIFSGNGNMSLALEITKILGINLGKATVGRFADGEVNVMIHENVRGKDIYVIQPTCPPVNENLMELLLMVSALNRASARRITVVIPYYGYARQDRKMQARVPISAADVARLLEAMGIDRVIAVDLHCGQIQGFFGPRVPVDNLDGGIVGINHFGDKDLHNPVIVSPDAGGVYRAKKFKEGLSHKFDMDDIGLAMIIKQRARAGTVDQMDLVGDVSGCDCVVVDDMIDTAGTLCKAAEVLKQKGARRVFAFASHGLLSGPGNDRIANSSMEECVILNTIPSTPQRAANEKLTELSVAPLLAQTIFNIHAKKSISALFK